MAEGQPTLFGTEIWKPLPEWEGFYEISSHGQIRSVDRTLPDGRRYRGKMLSPYSLPSGYRKVNLARDGKRFPKYMHRLVLETFHGPCPEGMETRHLNGDRSDNRVENLKWGTPTENNLDIVAHGRHNEARKTHCPQGHPLSTVNLVARKGRKCLSCSRAHALVWRRPEFLSHFPAVADVYYQCISKGEDTSVVVNDRIKEALPGVWVDRPARWSGRRKKSA